MLNKETGAEKEVKTPTPAEMFGEFGISYDGRKVYKVSHVRSGYLLCHGDLQTVRSLLFFLDGGQKFTNLNDSEYSIKSLMRKIVIFLDLKDLVMTSVPGPTRMMMDKEKFKEENPWYMLTMEP